MLDNGNINSITLYNYQLPLLLFIGQSCNSTTRVRDSQLLRPAKEFAKLSRTRTFIFKEENSNSYLVCNFGRFGS